MNKIKYKVKNNILNIYNTKVIPVVFQYPIVQVLAFEDILIIRIEPTPQSCFNENIYGVSYTGEIVWQVEKMKHVYDDSPYTGIEATGEENNIALYNWDGLNLVVNYLTGKVVSAVYGK